MATEYEAAELVTMHAADLKNRGEKVTTISAMAKYYASEVCVRNSTEAVQIHGGYGYIKDFPAEKFYRDSKLCTIGEGTSEIQKTGHLEKPSQIVCVEIAGILLLRPV